MGLYAALNVKEGLGEIVARQVCELANSCCHASVVRVYDFDAYAHALRGTTPPTSDGVWARSEPAECVILLEMKSINNMWLEFKHLPVARRGGQDADEVIEYIKFVKNKFLRYDLQGKLNGTKCLLHNIYNEFEHDIEHGSLIAQFVLVHDLDSREFLNFHSTIETALKQLQCPHWRAPGHARCEEIVSEDVMVENLGL